jgi:sugar/nucleoside kinase (ribokinase family)
VRTIRKEKAKIKALVRHSTRPYDVIAFGENSVDVLAVVSEWPQPDTKRALDRLAVLPGGQVATAAIAAKRLGARTSYLGVVGDDAWADVVRAALDEHGVDRRLVVRRETRTRSAVVLVDRAGRRTILSSRDDALALRPDELDEAWLGSGRILMLDGTDPPAAARAATLARQAGLAVMVDLDQPGDAADALLALADVAITSADFPVAHTGTSSVSDAMATLERRHRLGMLIVTRGAAGAIGRTGGREIAVAAPPVDVVDTTGAGDAFRGAFAASWIELGDEADPAELMRRAAIAGALSCRAPGAQAALPTRVELKTWL